jgi:hypothetical protein
MGAAAFNHSTGRFSASGHLTNVLSHRAKFRVVYFCNPPKHGVDPFQMDSRIITLGPGRSTGWTVHSPVLQPKSKLAHVTWANCAMIVRTPGQSY